ncbi:DUF2914 domain-containing protein [Geobacter pelophilus]|uniref:DUF2914 domain-containing protein n=1 Tax=Geoanaerobacter pelophilus TaxID=60036 RepID=A0AAW4KY59_9BACT|nr:DUF2914 domain-containing protein [Geoanaerobacter pelophilus]MBT0663299.1 DUF2914 domain-containing protein [Geoanaerobacter pelophilus]
MKKISLATMALVLPLLMLFQPDSEAATLKITEMAVTTKVVRGNPIDSVHRISSASVKQLFCFTRLVSDDEEETTIKHVWYRGNEKVGESELPVKGKKWRTYSSRVVEKGMAGDWRVDALDSDGKLLRTVKFRMN